MCASLVSDAQTPSADSVPVPHEKRVAAALLANRRCRTVAREHLRIVAERKEDPADRIDQGRVIATGQISAADRSRKQGIADEERLAGRPPSSNLQADAARAVSRRVVRPHLVGPEGDHLSRRIENVDRRRRLDAQSEQGPLAHRLLVEKQIVAMEVDRRAQRPFRSRDAGDVIDVSVGQQDVAKAQRLTLREHQQLLDLVTGIDQHRLAGFLAAEHEPVLEKRADRLSLDYHQFVILAVVDDLMFTSKIKTTAGQLGVPVAFARSSGAALDQMRKDAPSLVIFDLNSARLDPLRVIAQLKADPDTRRIKTLGFVSHVDAGTIAAAREAGVDEVLARSAFADRLGDILSS